MIRSYLPFALTVFAGFFAVMNPIANVPVFLGLVGESDAASRKRMAMKACLTAFAIVLSFTFLGKFIFDIFGITIPAFKITGGILLFFVGFEMLQSKKSSIQDQQSEKVDEGLAISPLGIPILAGPGTIVTAMNFSANSNTVHLTIIIGVFTLLIFLTYWAFILSEKIAHKVGSDLITVLGKIMGLLLAIMGTGMVIEGIKLAFDL